MNLNQVNLNLLVFMQVREHGMYYVYKYNIFYVSYLLTISFFFFSLGQKFANIEAITLSSVLLKNFKFELLPGQQYPPPFLPSLTFPMKEPLLVKVYKR